MENIEIESDEQIDSEERLSYMVMKRNWEEVLKIFRAYPEFRANRIDHRNSNTALHAAIINGAPESIIGQMVDLIVVVDTLTLSAGNYEGDTPLHCAAARGSVYICQRILQVDKSLVEKRNKKGETPLFSAALNDKKKKKKAFFYLHTICKEISSSEIWRRRNGDTILHVTIRGMNFDLSFQIIHLYEDTVCSYNQEGKTPLHILASNPSPFKSGTDLGWWEEIIYKFIPVEKLKKIEPSEAYKAVDLEPSESTDHTPDESYWNWILG